MAHPTWVTAQFITQPGVPVTGRPGWIDFDRLNDESNIVMVILKRWFSPRDRDEMQSDGVRFLYYIPERKYAVSAGKEALVRLSDHEDVESITAIPNTVKMEPSVAAFAGFRSAPSITAPFIGAKHVRVIFHQEVPFVKARQILKRHGISLAPTQTDYDSLHTLQLIRMTPEQIEALAGEDAVLLMTEPEPPAQPTNINAQESGNITDIQPEGVTGYDLDGSGVSVGVWDVSGVLLSHPQFGGRSSQVDGVPAQHFHATHVAGTVGANGKGNSKAEGMAPNVTLLCWNASLDDAEMMANAHRIVASNHSYRTGLEFSFDDRAGVWKKRTAASLAGQQLLAWGQYSTKSWTFDRIARHTNLSIVVSAGNNRTEFPDPPRNNLTSVFPTQTGDFNELAFDTINTIAAGKNTIAVGAINDIPAGATEIPDNAVTEFSSWGPTDDGRIKPDISANGSRLLSLNNSLAIQTKLQSGTSMSAPVVTGTLANLTQLFRQRFSGFDPDNAAMKAVLIHTARDAGSTKGPDYRFGWGVMDARAAADLIFENGTMGNHILTDSYIDSPKTYTASYVGGASIVATIVWTDPPALPNTGAIEDTQSKLMNDLDIKITGPVREHFPWSLNPENPSRPATRSGANHIDNVEQIVIDAPLEGEYSIEISGQVNLGSAQSYALCLTGLDLHAGSLPEERAPQIEILNPHPGTIADLIVPVQVHVESGSPLTHLSVRLGDELLHEASIDPASNAVIQPASAYIYHASFELNTFLIDNGSYSLQAAADNERGQRGEKQIHFDVMNVGVSFNLVPDGERRIAQLENTFSTVLAGLFIEKDGLYAIETHPVPDQEEADTLITLFGPENRINIIANDDDGGVDLFSRTVQFLEGGRFYFIEINGFQGSSGWFGIDVISTDELPSPPDESSAEPVEIFPITVNQPEKFVIDDFGDILFFSFSTPFLSNYRIRAFPEEFNRQGTFKLELFRPDDTLNPLEEGTFVNEISRNFEAGESLLLKVTSPKTKGAFSLEAAALSNEDPVAIHRPGVPVSVVFTGREPQDRWFTLEVPQTTTYLLEITDPAPGGVPPLNIFVYGPNDPNRLTGELFLSEKPVATFVKHLVRGNTYFIQLLSEAGEGSYTIEFNNPNLRLPFVALPFMDGMEQSAVIVPKTKEYRFFTASIHHPEVETQYPRVEEGRIVNEPPLGVRDWSLYEE